MPQKRQAPSAGFKVRELRFGLDERDFNGSGAGARPQSGSQAGDLRTSAVVRHLVECLRRKGAVVLKYARAEVDLLDNDGDASLPAYAIADVEGAVGHGHAGQRVSVQGRWSFDGLGIR